MTSDRTKREKLTRVETGPADFTVFHRGATLFLFFASGFAGLVYEVLWMKELGLLFGNTSYAAATTLAAFFLGLVTGAYYWGRRSARVKRPLRGYALLEAGVALSALLYFLLLGSYHAIYGHLFQVFEGHRIPFLAVKFLLSVGVLFPPSFFMGGTLPMMSQHLVRRRHALGYTASRLYAVNTLGAALGAYAAGFHLPRYLGFHRSYVLAIGTTGLVALLAWILGSGPTPSKSPQHEEPSPEAIENRFVFLSPRAIRALAFFSGFATLSLEVLWTRMFAQVLQNSVYTFSTILVTFLVALALGAALATWLIRKRYPSFEVVILLLSASAILVGATPFLFNGMTHGLEYVGGQRSFAGYIVGSFGYAASVLLVPGVLLGSLFPYLLRLAEPYARSVGRTVGDLAAINMMGAVSGSLMAGFFFLDLFGLWASIRLIATAYVCAAILVAERRTVRSKLLRALPVGGLLLLVSFLDPSRLPVVNVDPLEKGESVLQVWEGSSGIVSVVRQPASLSIKLDNDYSLGGTGAAAYEERQAHLPLVLHPRPRSVFFLGMGTGITAGAALLHPVERVVVCELGPNVVEAARTFFRPYVHGLFDDPRASVVAEDGRNYLLGTSERFDVIVADLFMPWKAGVGNLYSREHYAASLDRLRADGIYAQWLPLYQLSQEEFGIIARTMGEIFPLVTFWRGAMEPGWETGLLVGHRDPTPFDLEAVGRRLEETGQLVLGEQEQQEQADWELGARPAGGGLADLLLHYCGNLTAAGKLLERYPVNTDDRPIIEYEAPVTHRRSRAKEASWFLGEELLRFLGNLWVAAPPENDPYLSGLSHSERDVVRAGLSLYLARVLEKAGDERRASKAMREYERLFTGEETAEGAGESERDQTRQELSQLIEQYQQRIRALQEHLREAENEPSSSSAKTSGPEDGSR